MFVTCKLKNLCADDYNVITLRKLYQVIFWEKDLRTLNIYSAVVAGSENETTNARLKLKSNYDLEFGFTCTDQNNKPIQFQIEIVDKTGSFKSDTNAWQAVWGSDTAVINNADEFNRNYKVLFTTANNIQTNVNNNYLFIKDPKKDGVAANTIAKIISSTSDLPNKKYRVKTDIAELHDNTEIVNFSLATIKFTERQSTLLNYYIEFSENQKFTTFDNSIYFILPDGFDAKGKAASILLNNDTDPKEEENPFQTLDPDNKKYIHEWINKGIEDRKYFRVFSPNFKKFTSINNYSKFQFNFRIISIVNPIISQLIYGLLISLFFAYGLDQTRLMNFRTLFIFYKVVPPDVNFFVTYSLLFISILFRVSKGNTVENKYSNLSRKIAMLFSFLWFISLFIYPNSQVFYSKEIMSNTNYFNSSNTYASYTLNILSFFSNLLSLILLYAYHRDEINYSFLEQAKLLFSNRG